MVRLGELITVLPCLETCTKLGHVADLLVDGDRIIGIVLAGHSCLGTGVAVP